MTKRSIKRMNRNANKEFLSTIDNKIIEIKKWITEMNIKFIDILENKNLISHIIKNTDTECNEMLVIFIRSFDVPDIIVDYINGFKEMSKDIENDNILLNLILIYKNNVKFHSNFLRITKLSIEKFVDPDEECSICFNTYIDLSIKRYCKCSFCMCRNCYNNLSKCPICKIDYLLEK